MTHPSVLVHKVVAGELGAAGLAGEVLYIEVQDLEPL